MDLAQRIVKAVVDELRLDHALGDLPREEREEALQDAAATVRNIIAAAIASGGERP